MTDVWWLDPIYQASKLLTKDSFVKTMTSTKDKTEHKKGTAVVGRILLMSVYNHLRSASNYKLPVLLRSLAIELIYHRGVKLRLNHFSPGHINNEVENVETNISKKERQYKVKNEIVNDIVNAKDTNMQTVDNLMDIVHFLCKYIKIQVNKKYSFLNLMD